MKSVIICNYCNMNFIINERICTKCPNCGQTIPTYFRESIHHIFDTVYSHNQHLEREEIPIKSITYNAKTDTFEFCPKDSTVYYIDSKLSGLTVAMPDFTVGSIDCSGRFNFYME
ncbi:hypothetical protein AGMMS49975_27020 [Clostridia bacterium]|nr:hypothetical protein AGMMS49975_27020 [Clostridia bacterium]